MERQFDGLIFNKEPWINYDFIGRYRMSKFNKLGGKNCKTKTIGLYLANYYCHFLFCLSKLIFSLSFGKYFPTIVQSQVFEKQLHPYKTKPSRFF